MRAQAIRERGLDDLVRLLTAPAAPEPGQEPDEKPGTAAPDSLAAWWAAFRELACRWPDTFDRAVAGGFAAGRPGFAFAAGYQSALRRLVPDLPPEEIVSFSVTEEGGGHPRAIETTLVPAADGGFRLSGRKKWATLSAEGGLLLVCAREGVRPDGRPVLRMVRVAAGAPGVGIERMPDAPFAPEISHARIRFEDVLVGAGDLLPGDGYARYVKPFRTVEDGHVVGSILGHAAAVAARHGWPAAVREDLLGAVVALRGAAAGDPAAAETHLVLAAALRAAERALEAAEPHWEDVAAEVRDRWRRDRPLLRVAGTVREQRRTAAWARLGGGA